MADILAFAETRDGALRPVAGEIVAAARSIADQMQGQVLALVIGGPGSTEAASDLARYGADRILVAEDESLSLYNPDVAVEVVASAVAGATPGAILFPASAQGKDLAARVAARLDVALASEVTEIEVENGQPVVTRPMYGGKAYGRFRFLDSPALISLRPNVFPASEDPRAGTVEALASVAVERKTRVLGLEKAERETLDVREAPVVVAGGSGGGGQGATGSGQLEAPGGPGRCTRRRGNARRQPGRR